MKKNKKSETLEEKIKAASFKDYFRHDLVRQIMAARDWTEAFVAGRMGSDQSTFNKIKNGRLDIRITTLAKLALALEVEPHLLLNSDAAYVRTPDGWRLVEFYQAKSHKADTGRDELQR